MKKLLVISVIPILTVVLFLVALAPSTLLVMLALGNFGHSQFGFIDCLPAGAIIGFLAGSSFKSD